MKNLSRGNDVGNGPYSSYMLNPTFSDPISLAKNLPMSVRLGLNSISLAKNLPMSVRLGLNPISLAKNLSCLYDQAYKLDNLL